ncbi:hypothetical protein VMCG_01992 [Cytospora schulzeri]|uniref:Uncharacterized protein n=1 Tax=Cytospora schulzeri TaxID=448051 RepID=A0A423X483_9PEZI|nr:hypothetical protein VMCG_01992 [Valsa malicola]
MRNADSAGHDRIIHMLLRQQPGMDPDAPDSDGRTPLMHAVVAGHPAVVRALLAAGARCDAVDHMQRSVLHLAVLYRREQVLRLLLVEFGTGAGAGDGADDGGHRAGPGGQGGGGGPVVLHGLVEAGFGFLLDAYDADGNTPLHLAVAEGFEVGVAMLLRSGTDLEVRARRC